MAEKILIANRGEIALRVMRACNELGIASAMVYSEADRFSLPVRLSTESVCIGDAPATESYLRADRILSAASVVGATAIHPGYGFLSENAHFAEVCKRCGFTFIGPSASAIRLMGDKASAREQMRRAGVPVTPGSDGVLEDFEHAEECAQTLGFPVILKAVAGGGGRGMRIVWSKDELRTAFLAAKAEAEQAFADGRLFMEKYIVSPKHIEVQVIADSFGTVLHLGERDCSMQRRNQKLIEESPCIWLTDDMRQQMCQMAVKAVASIGYTGVGTIEFLVDVQQRKFYFMEMNTRIQVEHPVTEMVTGIDLVQEQIRIALGKPLSFQQSDVVPRGHAIEVRVNAEDAARGFAPCPGHVMFYSAPGGPGVRVDSHLFMEYDVPPNYDSLLAKLIVCSSDRESCIRRMERAIGEYRIGGITTTLEFSKMLLETENFKNGTYTTDFIEKFLLKQVDKTAK